jgi:juvenile hormone acid methyltransferase
MNKPKLYASCNDLSIRDSGKVISEYINSMSWKPGDRVLDMGCGPGNVTTEVLLPRLPADFGLLVGADMSADMIQYATETYTHSKLRFTMFDLVKDIGETAQLQPSVYDKIFSFFCLHFIQDHRKALRNVHSLLRTGGEILIVFFGTCSVYKAYEIQSRKPEWQPYMKDCNQFVTPSQNSSDPGEEFRKVLHDTGFEVMDCKCRDAVYIFDSLRFITDLLKSTNPFIDRIPRELQEQYMTDLVTELIKVNMGEPNNTDDGGISFNYGLVVAFARKI